MDNKSFPSFETERLLLRLATEDDAAFIVKLYNTPKWIQHIGDRHVYNVEQAREYIRSKMLPQIERLGYGNYIISRKSDDIRIGACGLYDREGIDGIDLGFALLPEYEGQGYAFEAAEELRDVGFCKIGLEEIKAITTMENTASQKLLHKLGLTFQYMIRIEGDPEEIMLFAVKKVKRVNPDMT